MERLGGWALQHYHILFRNHIIVTLFYQKKEELHNPAKRELS
jgi:hypothetical protein